MGVSLSKGQNVVLNQDGTPLADVTVGLGWDARPAGGADFDLDASAVVCGPDQRVLSDAHFVFYNNLTSPDGAVRHTGDNLTGEGDGDDEQILVDLDRLGEQTGQVVFTVSIHDAEARGQNFGQVEDAYIRVVDNLTGREMCRYELSYDAAGETAMVFGALYRRGGEWKFRAIGQGYATGLAGIATDYGVNVG
ncbi:MULTISPECIES: TerD family protein [Streptomyces]|uniref:TerD family protein n=2 Tax=Streptomyces rimosus subsp. rimosus TaxID=132474 RepID=L8ESM8_STRR1|nr:MULTISPECIES: TerD family protein [Streptomyces]KOG81567.1 chemical-damaging agent resistance protein C [Kitasatospora aureofaciens]MYT42782.1 chemical-damaging agent resistance protein C [Streptomyces sp. SID5471]KEF05193.1 chemical-damaging agent resistance protein C [Streptomyces rimosus]KEF19392.1 chemical-damaging agent resistance protein C [Streptomyces rimosus]KOT30899.1 chemical-damaging agent resistance protein C [Streptomyces sp. NRRL WC-3701]